MALTLSEIRQHSTFANMSDQEIISNVTKVGGDVSLMQPEPDPNEAGALRSYVTLPLLKGVADASSLVSTGLGGLGLQSADKYLRDSNQRVQENLTARQSQSAQQDAQKTFIDENGDFGFGGDHAGVGTIVQSALQSAPGFVAMGAMGTPLAGLATRGAQALGMGAKIAQVAGSGALGARIAEVASSGALGNSLAKGLDVAIGSSAGFGASEGIFSAASNAAQHQTELESTDIGKMSELPAFKDAYHNKTDPQLSTEERLLQARDIVARQSSEDVFTKTALWDGLTGMATGGGALGLMRGNVLKATTETLGKALLKGFASEGGQETIQSMGEQFIGNQAKQEYSNKDQALSEGVVEQGIQGGLAGGLMGMAGGAIGRHGKKPSQADNTKTNLPPTDNTTDIGAHQVNDVPENTDLNLGIQTNDTTTPTNPNEIVSQDTNGNDATGLPDATQAEGTKQAATTTTTNFKLGEGYGEQQNMGVSDTATYNPNVGANNPPAQNAGNAGDNATGLAGSGANSAGNNQGTSTTEQVNNAQTPSDLAPSQTLTAPKLGLQGTNKDTSGVNQAATENQAEPVQSFVPTHQLNDGTPVAHLEDNLYQDANGDEWQADDAQLLKTQPAPAALKPTGISNETKSTDQKTNAPEEKRLLSTDAPITGALTQTVDKTFPTLEQVQRHGDRRGKNWTKETHDKYHQAFVALVGANTQLAINDPDTVTHENRVAGSVAILAKKLGLAKEQVVRATVASLGHDLGKRGMKDMLSKQGKLTPEEIQTIRQHPDLTREIMREMGLSEEVIKTAGEHHETAKENGGYPEHQGKPDFTSSVVQTADIADSLIGGANSGHNYPLRFGNETNLLRTVKNIVRIMRDMAEKGEIHKEVYAKYEEMLLRGEIPHAQKAELEKNGDVPWVKVEHNKLLPKGKNEQANPTESQNQTKAPVTKGGTIPLPVRRSADAKINGRAGEPNNRDLNDDHAYTLFVSRATKQQKSDLAAYESSKEAQRNETNNLNPTASTGKVDTASVDGSNGKAVAGSEGLSAVPEAKEEKVSLGYQGKSDNELSSIFLASKSISEKDAIAETKNANISNATPEALQSLVSNLTEGGRVVVMADGKRSQSTNPDWFINGAFVTLKADGNEYAKQPSVAQIKQAVTDYAAGNKLKAQQQSIINSLNDVLVAQEEASNRSYPYDFDHEEILLALSIENKLNQGDITPGDIDSALDEFDDSIPFDVSGSNLTAKELNDFWGIDEQTESEKGAGISQEEILQQYTETELDKQAREQANRDKLSAEAELKAKQKQQADKEVDLFADEMMGSGGTATYDIFGGNPMANLGRAEPIKLVEKDKPVTLTTKGVTIADKANEDIQDFGDKLEGAKKFTYTFKEALTNEVDTATVPLSKSFPQPDYDKLIASGVDPRAAAFIAQIRGELPLRPKKYGVSSWVQKVNHARSIASGLIDGTGPSIDKIIAASEKQDSYTKYLGDVLSIANDILPSQIKALGGFKLQHTLYSLYDSVKNVWKWEVTNTSDKKGFGGWSSPAKFDTKEQAIAHIKKQVSEESEAGEPLAKFDVWSERGKPGFFVGKKISIHKYIELKHFDSSNEARAYIKENNKELVDQLKQKKSSRDVRRAENNERIGKDYRNGKNVDAKQFTDTFGFRGVQFGNWVNNDRRQQDLNNAYDGLMDLAEVLGLPPKALALNGELGLAFGARGTGGIDAASAHYESQGAVINLTKTNGAGSLAHEWWHAVDNYFGKQEGRGGEKFITDAGARPLKVRDGSSFRSATDADYQVRREVFDAWQGVTKAIREETQMAKRAGIKDKTRSKDYWSTVSELTARTFERYVIDKLATKGYESDYLANIITEDAHNAMNEMFGTEDAYVYPLQSEMEAVNKAYDALFGTVETKETDQGTAIYEPEAAYQISDEPDGTYDAGWRNTALQRPQVVNAKTGTVKTGITEVSTPEDALHIISSFSDYAQEQMLAIVLDKNNKVIQVIKHTSGLNDSSVVDPGILAGSIHGIKGARSVYFAHNHPSGIISQSQADFKITDKLTELLRGTGVTSKGMLVTVNGKRGSFYDTEQNWRLDIFDVKSRDITETEAVRTKNIGVTERKFTRNSKLATEKITGPDDAMRITQIIANGRTGILLMDNQHTPVSFVEMTEDDMLHLRTGKVGFGASLLLKEIHETNARAMIAAFPASSSRNVFSYSSAGKNLSAFAGSTAHTRFLDVIVGRTSLNNEGVNISSTSTYFSKSTPTTGSTVQQVKSWLPTRVKTLVTSGKLVVVQSVNDLPAYLQKRGTALYHAAFHGSPHDHNKFDSAKIGTGEGAKAFGYGHYFTDKKGIAEWYRDNLSKNQEYLYKGKSLNMTYQTISNQLTDDQMLDLAARELVLSGMDMQGQIRRTSGYKDRALKTPKNDRNDYQNAYVRYADIVKLLKLSDFTYLENKGKLYTVELAPTQDEYLDWSKPLSEQSKLVRNALDPNNILEKFKSLDAELDALDKKTNGGKPFDLFNDDIFKSDLSEDESQRYAYLIKIIPIYKDAYQQVINGASAGETIYKALTKGLNGIYKGDKEASEFLYSLGIRGIRYKAEAGKSDANNYVVFSDDDISITEKYSKDLAGVEALYDSKTDTLYLVADMLNKDTLNPILSHELTHRAIATDPKIKAAVSRFEADLTKRFNDALQGKGSAIELAAAQRVTKAGTPVKDQLEEFIAYINTQYAKNPDSITGKLAKAFKDFIAAIRVMLIRNGLDFGFIKSLTPADLMAMSGYGVNGINNSSSGIKASKAPLLAPNGKPSNLNATSNNGQFSESNNDIRFSKSQPSDIWDDNANLPTTTQEDMKNRAKYGYDSLREGVKKLGLSALTQNQLSEIGGEILPTLKRLPIERNHYDVETSKWHGMADDLAKVWERLAPNFKRFDDAWKLRNKLEQSRLADMMHEVTVSGIDPREPAPKLTDKNAIAVLLHKQLKDKFNKLLPATQQLFSDVAQFHQDVFNELTQSITGKIEMSEMPQEKKEELIAAITAKFKTQKGVYFPLMRNGEYWVNYEGGMQMFETKAEQQDFIKQTLSEGKKVLGYGKSLQNFSKVEGVDAGFIDSVDTLIDNLDVEQAAALKDGIFQLYLDALPENSMRKHFIHRKKTPGWEQDALKSFSKKASHDGRQLAKLKYAPAMRQVLNDAEEIVKIGDSDNKLSQLKRRLELLPELLSDLDNGVDYKDLSAQYDEADDKKVIARFARYTDELDREKAIGDYLEQQEQLLKDVEKYKTKDQSKETASDVITALRKSVDNMMTSNTSPYTNLINQVVFTYFLGFNPASAVVNLIQTPATAMPVVAGRHGFIQSSKALVDAVKVFYGNKDKDGFSIGPGLTIPGEKTMFNELVNDGTFDRTRSHDLAGLSEEGIARGTWRRDFMNASTYMFHKGEVANREITALMAYRMEFAKTHDVQGAIKYARYIINQTHLDYSSANRPDLFQGNTARVFLQFKMYSQGMTYLWGKTTYDAIVSKDPTRKQEARATILALVGMQMATAGVLGLPIGGLMLAAQALANLGGDDDEPVDMEIEIRKFLQEIFGADTGRILSRGLLSESGADFHGRLSMSDLWFREPDRELEGKDEAYYLLKTIVGPIGGMLENFLVGLRLMGDGDAQRGLETMLPKSITGMAKTYRMMNDGGATSLTGNMLYETSQWEEVLQALGMRPSGLAERQLQNTAIKNRESAVADTKSKLINHAAQAKMKGDREAYNEVWQDIKSFNAKYPALRITPQTIIKSVKTRKTNQRNTQDGLVVKKKLNFIRNDEKFIKD